METDVKLKVLFRKYAAGLLELTGDAGSEVLSAEVVELQDFKRSVDCLLKLRRGQEVYYRHVEFQAEADPAMPERCFRYNTQLVLAAADRRIEDAAPGEAGRDAAAILLLLAGWHYTVDELSKAVRRSKMIRSSVWEEALAEGRTEGLTEGLTKGRVDAERELCADLVRDLHPAIAARLLPVIESCSDPFALKRWALLAAKGTDADLLKELGLG